MNTYQITFLYALYVFIAAAAYIEHRYNQSRYYTSTWFIALFFISTFVGVIAGGIHLYIFLGAL
jgi:hypothetical protein